MIVEFDGKKVRIPRGYTKTEDGTFINCHGVEYQLVSYGWKDSVTVCLETIYSKHIRTVKVEVF